MTRSSALYIAICIVLALTFIGCGGDDEARLQYETLPFPTTGNIVALSFISADEGYIATGSEVYYTKDAGGSFVKVYQSDGRNIMGVHFVDDDLGFIFGDGGLLARSEDGGTNWQNVSVNNNYRLTAMQTVGDERLQLVGTVMSDTVPAPAIMGSSSDDGITWSFSGVPYHGFCKVESASATHSWILGADAVMYTTDGGKTWEHTAARSELKINDFSFSDLTHGWEVSSTGAVRYTSDGGWSWERKVVLPDSASARVLTSVDAPETDRIYVAGDRLIAMTQNHGLKWYVDDVSLPARLNVVQAMGGKVYFGGNGGLLLRLLY